MRLLKYLKRNKKKIVGSMTTFPALKAYRDFVQGKITIEEYSKIKNLDPITKSIYDKE